MKASVIKRLLDRALEGVRKGARNTEGEGCLGCGNSKFKGQEVGTCYVCSKNTREAVSRSKRWGYG